MAELTAGAEVLLSRSLLLLLLLLLVLCTLLLATVVAVRSAAAAVGLQWSLQLFAELLVLGGHCVAVRCGWALQLR